MGDSRDSVASLRAALADAKTRHEAQSARALALLREKDMEIEALRSPSVRVSPASDEGGSEDGAADAARRMAESLRAEALSAERDARLISGAERDARGEIEWLRRTVAVQQGRLEELLRTPRTPSGACGGGDASSSEASWRAAEPGVRNIRAHRRGTRLRVRAVGRGGVVRWRRWVRSRSMGLVEQTGVVWYRCARSRMRWTPVRRGTARRSDTLVPRRARWPHARHA